jgi:hypothetical protein
MKNSQVFISIDNSDDKLTQAEWGEFCDELKGIIILNADIIYGVWHSLPNSKYQNMCISFKHFRGNLPIIKEELAALCTKYNQDSIAFSYAKTTMITKESSG